MGFPCMCHDIILPRPIEILLCILQRVWYAIAVVLSYLGIQIAHEVLPGQWSPEAHPANPSPATITPTVVKSRLQVVEFASFLARRKPRCPLEEPTCMVCLGWMEAKDEMRELGNCTHAFHKACIDRWVDMGHVTCPLCRLELLPSHKEKKRVWIKSLTTWPRLHCVYISTRALLCLQPNAYNFLTTAIRRTSIGGREEVVGSDGAHVVGDERGEVGSSGKHVQGMGERACKKVVNIYL